LSEQTGIMEALANKVPGEFLTTQNLSGDSVSTVVDAKDYLKGASLTPEQTLELVKRLKKEDKIGLARRVLGKARATNLARR
jgi:hypothetical protein